MDTNKKLPFPTQIIQPLTIKKKKFYPPKNLNSLKNQHPYPPQKNKPPKSPRSGKIS